MAEPVEYVCENPKISYEKADWPIGKVGLVYLGVFVFLVIAPFILMAAFPRAVSDTSRRLLIEPAAPRLQISPSADLARFEAEQDKKLNTYYWIDKPKGIVHIPIDEAMKRLVNDGIPGFPKSRK